jgi:lysyl-tRNA synthetase class 2
VLLRSDLVRVVPVSHALALPLAAGLLVASPYLWRRRGRAWLLALLVVSALLVLSLVRGPDFGEVGVELVVLGMLFWGRRSFVVGHRPLQLSSAWWRLPLLIVAAWLLAFALVWAASPAGVGIGGVSVEALRLLAWLPPSFRYHDEVGGLSVGIGLIGVAVLVCGAYLVFRPLAVPRDLPNAMLRAVATALVQGHGSDTLAYFKLRRDKHYLFSADGRAFLGYRVENRVLLVSGDPVGPADALPGLIAQACSFAELRGLKIAALGASEALLQQWRQVGLRSLYLGDEAIINTAGFTLEGRGIRKVRQSVNRLESAGYQAELVEAAALSPAQLDELEAVNHDWRAGAPERGFAMALDSLNGDGTLLVVARDSEGRIRGFLQFVPTYGRAAVSLSLMRRQRDTPNGFNDYLVSRSIALLHDRSVNEVSLNFAAFARFLHSPASPGEKLLARLIRLANPYFQIESLYRFNAKFFPDWQPRYLVYQGTLTLPRAGLAALWAEGQLPKPRLRLQRSPQPR